jgi:hypothetical protein
MADDMTCAVCEQTVDDPALLSDCDYCGVFFHLNPRSDVEGIDCGDVWAGNTEAPSLQFQCQPCIDGMRGEALAQGLQVTPAQGMTALPPGMPPLPPGAPPEALAAIAGFAVPTTPTPGEAPEAPEASGSGSAPPPLERRPRQRRRFRRIDS